MSSGSSIPDADTPGTTNRQALRSLTLICSTLAPTCAWYRMAGIATAATALKPTKNLPAEGSRCVCE